MIRTHTKPALRPGFGKGWYLMAYRISDDCIACGACADECPVSCISEGDGKYVINEEECISCGTCAGVCPVSAPVEAE